MIGVCFLAAMLQVCASKDFNFSGIICIVYIVSVLIHTFVLCGLKSSFVSSLFSSVELVMLCFGDNALSL